MDMVIRSTLVQAEINNEVSKDLLLKAVELLPEINLIVVDASGFYSGHSIYFPIKREKYLEIRSREISESDISIDDLVDFRKVDNPVFYLYDLSADCNETFFIIVSYLNSFFDNLEDVDYTTASITSRHDSYKLNEQLDTVLVWEDTEMQKRLNSKAPIRLYESKKK
jgi:hypothetical protein